MQLHSEALTGKHCDFKGKENFGEKSVGRKLLHKFHAQSRRGNIPGIMKALCHNARPSGRQPDYSI